MKLVCFSNYTGGALVCDLLNKKTTKFTGSTIPSREHDMFKIGDVGFGVYRTCDSDKWLSLVSKFKNLPTWFGTHCHPSSINNLSDFDEIISITTESEKSKWYRFLRAYHIYFEGKLSEVDGLIDRMFDEFESHPSCKNIEFEDIVNGKFVEEYQLNVEYFNEWKCLNSWLYSDIDTSLSNQFNKRLKKGKRNAIQKPN
jgi:hypothetical protein